MSLLPLLAACGTGTDTGTGSESHASDGGHSAGISGCEGCPSCTGEETEEHADPDVPGYGPSRRRRMVPQFIGAALTV